MRRLIYVFITLLALVACGEKLTVEQQAAEAAQKYYNRILEGYTDGFASAHVGFDSLPDDYRQQLLKAHELYVKDIREKHGGLRQVSVSENAGYQDTVQHVVYAFLMLSFKDSTQEQVTVPMVQYQGEWMMK
jgi:hypothetical protein